MGVRITSAANGWAWEVKKTAFFAAFALLFSTAGPFAAPADSALNQYYAMRKASPDRGIKLLRKAEQRHPNDLRIRLELGYYYLGVNDRRAALPRFVAATRIAPSRADLWKQLGYIYLGLGHNQSALAAFRAGLRKNPRDHQLSLQIAYLLQNMGDNRGSARQFRRTIASPISDISQKSCSGYSNLRGLPNRLFPKPYFGEIYLAPEYNNRHRLGVFPLQMRLGVTLSEYPQVEAYVGLRSNWDNRSGVTAAGSQVYNDNAAVFAAGLRVKPIASIPLFFFVEAGSAYDITYRLRPRWREDVRAGFQYYQEWNTQLVCDAAGFRIRPIADVYADGVYYSRYDDNVLFFGRFRPGLRLFEAATWAIDSYVNLAFSTDTRNVPGNRYQEAGLGLAFRLYDPVRLNLRAEAIRVFRTGGIRSHNTFRIRLEHQSRF